MKVAIVYDRVNKIGGAERVLESLSELFPGATLFTSVYDKERTPWARKFKVKTSFLQKIPFLKNKHEYIPYLMPLAFENINLTDFDLIISVTSEGAKGIIAPTNSHHVCICLTPTRYLWSGYDQYFKNPLVKFISKPLVHYLRQWDLQASQKPDKYIAISENVKKRIKKYYSRESVVIYPPSDRLFKKKLERIRIAEKNYFLVVSRLVSYKKIDIAIKACNKLNLNLVVIGEGNEFEKLSAIAMDNIIFKGKVTDEELISYYKNCNALIFPGEEDFGITMVEAQLSGKPVIAFKNGGAAEILVSGKTGLLFEKQTVNSLISVLKKFKKFRYNSNYCRQNAKRFSEEKFKKNFIAFLRNNQYI